MAGRTAVVDQYLANLEGERQTALTAIRDLILETVPAAEESLQYRMPTYEHAGTMLCAFASQKQYMSLYMNTGLVEKHRASLTGLDVGKSCIRFRKLDALPLDTVRAILNESAALGQPEE